MKTYRSQITIFYNPMINKHKKTIAHAKSIGAVLAFPFDNMPSANTVWTRIWNQLGRPATAIFDKDSPKYKTLVKDRKLNFRDWKKIAVHNPDMIQAPIAINGSQVVICNRQTEIYDLMQVAR